LPSLVVFSRRVSDSRLVSLVFVSRVVVYFLTLVLFLVFVSRVVVSRHASFVLFIFLLGLGLGLGLERGKESEEEGEEECG
jgi:hypothetical protein